MSGTPNSLTFSVDTIGGIVAPGAQTRFGYDAIEDRGRRKAPVIRLRSEDDEATASQRGQAITLTRDLRRNFSIASWAIRKHLDYVANFTFQSKTGNKDFDRRVEELMRWYGRAGNFDAAGRHGLRRFTRLCEAHRTVDGDIFLMLLASGQIQAIEGDRIRTPTSWPGIMRIPPDWVSRMRHGVLLDNGGKAIAFAVNRRGAGIPLGPDWMRGSNTFTFERLVPAKDMIQLGYFDRFDQVRGASLFISAANTLRDVYEGFDYALAKAKVAQMIALKMTGFEKDDELPQEINWGRGPVTFHLSENEDIALLQGNTPSNEWQAFIQFTIAASLKAFDIPFSFYDESHTNYSGGRGAWLQYDISAEQKREDIREMLDRLTAWRLAIFIAAGVLELPRDLTPQQLTWGWIANRVPWIDPLKEVQAYRQSVAGGFDSTPGVATAMSRDAYELAQEEAKYQNFRESLGLQRTDVPLAPVPITIYEGDAKKEKDDEE